MIACFRSLDFAASIWVLRQGAAGPAAPPVGQELEDVLGLFIYNTLYL